MQKLLSAAVLLVVVAAFSGGAWAHKEEAHDGIYAENAASKLPPAEAAQFREMMKDAYEQNKNLRTKIPALRKDLHKILTAEKFDADAFISKSNELKDLHDKMTENWTAAFASAVEDLPQSDRRKLAGAMAKKMRKHHWTKRNDYPTPPKETGTVTPH